LYSSAGHPTGFVLDSSGEVKMRLSSTGGPLGISSSDAFPAAPAIPLAPGDLVLLITDGVLEAMSPDRGLFGQERALAIVRAHRQHHAQDIANALCRAARAFYEGEPQRDDMTAVVIKARPVPVPSQ
jgi:serine phosphatase RsbU (regulator of sigma subunit)